jgi:uracil-DNA glycosylase family 4
VGRKHPLANCESCPFADAPFVPTYNPQPRAKLAVIGEAPGAYEAARGIPFTGPSGRLLDQVLVHHGYARDDVMLSNVCLCRPENNADPPKTAVAACKPRLDAEIAKSGVKQILAVGGTAASALIDPKKKITNLRVGRPKPYVENPEVEVIATWHPAYCLRVPDAFPSFVSDTNKLHGGYSADWTEPRYKIFDSPSGVRSAVERLQSLPGPFVIDIECGVEKDTAYVHPDHYDLLCLGIAYAPGRAVVLGGSGLIHPEVSRAVRRLLRTHSLIAHNGKFDLAGLYPYFGELELWADTMLMSYCVDERPGLHGLKKLGIEVLGTPDWEAQIRQWVPRGGNYADIPRDVLYKYNAYDVAVTWDLWELFSKRMDARAKRQHDLLIQASNALMGLERAGISFDVEYSKELQTVLEEEIFEIEMRLWDIAGRNINPRSPQQITRWFAEGGIDLPTTEADFLEQIRPRLPNDNQRAFIDQLLLHRRRAKLNGTYVKGFQKRIYKSKIYTTYTLHGTTSGRLASKNPNMQNIVRDERVKHQFTVESPDHVLIQIDYKQAEARVITHLAQDDYLAEIFRDPDRDIFDELCNDIYGKGKWNEENRVSMKSIFYGNAYGRGANAICLELQQQGSSITLLETRKLMREFNATISKTAAWQEAIKNQVLSGKDLVTPFGRKRSFWLITEQNRSEVLNEALSFMPQSIASDITLTALIRLQPKLRSLATTRLTIHDAMVFECREEDSQEVIDIASGEMVAAGLRFSEYVPFAVDVKIGKRWSEL